MNPADFDIDQLIYAAIRLDLRTLLRSNHPGSIHFARVLELHPSHINYGSRLSNSFGTGEKIQVDDSILFRCGESLRLTLTGQHDEGRAAASALDNGLESNTERLLAKLMQAWLTSNRITMQEAEQLRRSYAEQLPPDIRARIALQLMTWTRATAGLNDAKQFYDSALRDSRGELRKAIQTVGADFDRDGAIFFAPFRSRTVRYESIQDRVLSGARSATKNIARQRIEGPFVRHFGRSPGTLPDDITAAEIQAEWCGAYWVLKSVWRAKAHIIVGASSDPDELTDSVCDWVLSGEINLGSLVDTVESHLSAERLDRLLHDRLLDGERLQHHTWIELCSYLHSLLPQNIATKLISSIPIQISHTDGELSAQADRSVRLFARLVLHAPQTWQDRFSSLDRDSRQTIAAALPTSALEILPPELCRQIANLALGIAQNGSEMTAQMALNIAYVLNQYPELGIDSRAFLELMPERLSAVVALNYPSLTQSELIKERQGTLIRKLTKERLENLKGRWTSHGTSLALELAQTMLALRKANSEALTVLRESIESPATSTDELIDALKALQWLLDDGLLEVADRAWLSTTPYRDSDMPSVTMWSGGNGVRAANAHIAGIRLRTEQEPHEPLTRLAFAARDSEITVRLAAIETLAVDGSLSEILSATTRSVFDSIALGAVFDPDSRVQASGVRLIPRIADMTIRELALSRIISEWSKLHSRVRVSAAAIATQIDSSGLRRQLTDLAKADVSVVVRRVVSG
ncbi:hypothetical protein [Gordonia sp. NPDC127522]|uniref:hypothetical protein n=1 Tax=Gordonia sp. NPDC127522 TaxID=3345390 RepID=UPI00363FBE1E